MDYIKRSGKYETLSFNYNISVTSIVLKPEDGEPKKQWEFKVIETNKYGITHTTLYYSTNLLSLEQYREQLLKEYNDKMDSLYRSSMYSAKKIKPNIFERIFADNTEKIK